MELPLEASALITLKERFGFDSFRAGQEEIVHSVFNGNDVLAVMPTGGGKSLGYALPALLLPNPVIVISPLIALMKDQVDSLQAKQIPCSLVNSTVPFDEQRRRVEAFKQGRLRLLFVAPERFRSPRFLQGLAGFRPSLFAVDEAHCISEWGHDFRPDYLRLAEAAEQLGRPPILALTATATPEVRRHIAQNLGMTNPAIIVKGFERPNLDFAVKRTTGRDAKLALAREEIDRGKTGILYASTRKNVEEATRYVRAQGIRAGFYHAGLSDPDRRAVQERFADGTLPVVIATNAFGMGIDRADLRFVVHLDTPGSIEAYTQEAGRAGRDGKPARCTLLHSPSDSRLQRFFVDSSYPQNDVILATRDALKVFGDGALVDLDYLAEKVVAPHPRAVESAVRILEEHGVASRVLDGQGRFVRFEKDQPIPLDLIRERADREYVRLQHMLDYAERAGCHRAHLVNYFTGTGDAKPCETCDGCRIETERRPLSSGEMDVVRSLLSVVRSLSGRYGKRRLIGILSGSRAKEILSARLDRHPDYGTLRHLSAAFLDRLMNECIGLGLVKIEGGEYPVLSFDWSGNQVLRGERKLELLCFGETERSGATRSPSSSTRSEPPPPVGADAELVGDLRKWRKEQSAREGCAAFMVLSNRVIDELARERPKSLRELLSVKGIGPSKVDRYGDALVALISPTKNS